MQASHNQVCYRPTTEELDQLNFWEGYGEIWISEGTQGYSAVLDFHEEGTYGFIIDQDGNTKHAAIIESFEGLKKLIEAVNLPF